MIHLRDFYEEYYFVRMLLMKLELLFHHFLIYLNKQNTGIMSLKNIGTLILIICLATNWSLNISVNFLRLIIQGKRYNYCKMYLSCKTFFLNYLFF